MDSGFSADQFQNDITVSVQRLGANFLEFDLVGVSPAIANAIRRIIISEVPTMAIETVFVVNNTSIIADEVLSHRLGLIPIRADPRKFEYLASNGQPQDNNTIVMELKAKCNAIAGKSRDLAPSERLVNSSVYSGDIKWIPQGGQAEDEDFKNDPIRPVHDDILIAKLRQEQCLDLELHCVKGVGKDHAKWSPVSCASYRLLPRITLKSHIFDDAADRLAACFPKGVIAVMPCDDQGNLLEAKSSSSSPRSKKSATGSRRRAIVINPRKDTVTREVLRHDEFADKVILSRVHDHFLFQLETTGFYGPVDVVDEGMQVLIEKCSNLLAAIDSL